MTERLDATARVRRYWEALRVKGALPQRSAIDPRALPGAIGNMFLIERVSNGTARFRVAGALLSDVMGMDVRGMPFLSVIEPGLRPGLAARVEQVFQDPCILDLSLESAAAPSGARLSGRVVLLPVESVRGVDIALGCLRVDGMIGMPPRRFRLQRAMQERVLVDAAPRMAFAEPEEPFRHAPPKLRLVHSADRKISKDGDQKE